MPTKQKKVSTTHTNDNLQTLYVDGVEVSKREDGMYFIRFTTDLPAGTFEQFRVIADEDNLHGILDIICQVSDYYPKKSVKRKKTKTPKKS
jgi:hypothetical protein